MAIQQGTVLNFGIDFAEETYGLLQDYDIDNKIQRVTAVAPDGKSVSIQEFGPESKLRLRYYPLSASSTDEPEIGTPFVFDGATWQIDNISDSRVIDGFESKEVTATYYEGVH